MQTEEFEARHDGSRGSILPIIYKIDLKSLNGILLGE